MARHIRHTILDAASMPVMIREPGRQRRRAVSLFEVMVQRLASGQTSRRRSVVPFIRLALAAAGAPDVPDPPPAKRAPPTELEQARGYLRAVVRAGDPDAIDAALQLYTDILRGTAAPW